LLLFSMKRSRPNFLYIVKYLHQFNHQMTLFSSFIFPYISLFTISVS